jgi:hypothetical protein
MTRRIRVTRFCLWFFFIAFAAPGFTDPARMPQGNEEARDFKIFADRIQQYVKMQKNLKASLPSLNPTKDTARILEHQHALARIIADARRNARQGDIFTPAVTARIRKIIDKTFHGPEGRLARETIRSDSLSKVVVLRVNDVCPEDIPVTTTPPTLLLKLPTLPQELTYRIVGHDLTLQDTEARLIVDLIPNAIR